jgi:protein disulfide-isomerase
MAAEAPSDTQGVAWETNLKDAWQRALRQNRPLLLMVSLDHCGYCTKMKQETFRDADLADRIGASYVAVLVDAKHNAEFVRKLGVRVYPSTFLISADSKILARVEGYLSAGAMQRRLTAADRTDVARRK